MANHPNDFRDPKVTQDTGGGIGKWIAIAIGALLLLLLLGWLLGLFNDDEAVVVTDDAPDAVIVTPDADPDAVVVTE